MATLIPIQYGKRKYPNNICPKIQEIAAHFDAPEIKPVLNYSLHTEYSYGFREFGSPHLEGLEVLKKAHKRGVPQLWRDTAWGEEFAIYLERVVGRRPHPKIIEIHPPFDDYCPFVETFFEIYMSFEERIGEIFPDAKVFLENRTGTVYPRGKFLISTAASMKTLADGLKRTRCLGIVFDLPQLFTAQRIGFPDVSRQVIDELFQELRGFRAHIKGLHLWGKKANATGRVIAHQGNLNNYFVNPALQEHVLMRLKELLDDGTPRYFVPEVNSNDADLNSIVTDLLEAGFHFVVE